MGEKVEPGWATHRGEAWLFFQENPMKLAVAEEEL